MVRSKRIITLLSFLILTVGMSSHAQLLFTEIPFNDQIENAELIIEGEVIDKKSYWNSQHTHIYTVNKIKVFKVFKGQTLNFIEIITPGGIVGLNAESVSPSLTLNKKEVGVFMLSSTTGLLLDGSVSEKYFETFGSLQGFYSYNLETNTANNVFYSWTSRETLYQEILNFTKKKFIEIENFSKINDGQNQHRTLNSLNITSISPTSASAGTESVLTITGSEFGNTQGTVGFPNADDGGNTYIDAYDQQVLSWTDSEIQVLIPSFAGTGSVSVTTSGGTTFFSNELNIEYALINLVPDNDDPPMEYPTQLINEDNQGGFTWVYSNGFNSNTEARDAFKRSFDSWVCTTGVNWKIGGSTNTDQTELDMVNIIRFVNEGELPASTLGRTTSYYNGCTTANGINWFVVELDIAFNENINWNFSTNPPTGNEVDFETVAVHELGHGLQLGHVIKPDAIMHFEVAPRIANRDLAPSDINGAEEIVARSTGSSVCGQSRMTIFNCDGSPPEEPLGESILIFPNPTEGNLTIKRSNESPIRKIELFDSTGRLVLEQQLNPTLIENVIQLGFLRPGFFFLKIISDSETISKNIVVK